MFRTITILLALFGAGQSAMAAPELSLNAGYTDLNVASINRDNLIFERKFHGSPPPGAYNMMSSGIYSGTYADLGLSTPLGDGLKGSVHVQYIQSAVDVQNFLYIAGGGPTFFFYQEEQARLIPVMLGLSADHAFGPLSLSGGLSAGYAFASIRGERQNQGVGFVGLPPSGPRNADGGNFVAEAAASADWRLSKAWSLGLQAAYRYANIGEMTDENGGSFRGLDGRTLPLDLSGLNLGGSLNLDLGVLAEMAPYQGLDRYVSLDAGYTTLSIRGLNSDVDLFNQLINGAPFPVNYTSQKIENGFFVEAAAVLPDSRWHPGLKVQYVQSGLGEVNLSFNNGSGPQHYYQTDQVVLLPVLLGLNPELGSLGPVGFKGSLYAGYGFAEVTEDLSSTVPFGSKPNSVYRAGGGGFVVEGGLSANYHLASRWNLDLRGSYRLADVGYLYDTNNQAFTGIGGNRIDFDLSGFNLGGGISYGF